MPPKILLTFLLASTGMRLGVNADDTARPWNRDVIYFALLDRFFDGDPANNVPPGSDPSLHDATRKDIAKYHGGDFRGLEVALQKGYFRELGVTALWISPPVKNVWNSSYDLGGPKTGYHGYWAQDFLDIDPHWTSRRALDGTRDYPDSRDGRMQHYRDFVALAHGQGIKVIQDVVCNHAGPVFFYDANGDGKFDTDARAEWIQPFKTDGVYDNATWANNPAWNQLRTEPAGPRTILGRAVKTTGALAQLDAYGRKGFSNDSLGKSDGTERKCDFFALRDFWTAPGSPVFERLVDEFVEIYAFYIEEIGIDGLRLDTVKHVDHEFWDAFTERLRKRLGPERAKRLLLFGEVYDGNATKLGAYTYRADYPQRRDPCLDSLLNFTFCFAAREFLRSTPGQSGDPHPLERAIKALTAKQDGRENYNATPGADGLSAREKIVNFVENHDGLNRFRVAGIGERQNLLAQALTLTVQGIPCLYYGTEASLQDDAGKPGKDSETGRLTLIPAGKAEAFERIRESSTFRTIAALNKLRRQLPALTDGEMSPIWTDSQSDSTDDGIFAFARYVPDSANEVAVIVINASARPSMTRAKEHRMKIVSQSGKPLLRKGDQLEVVPIAGFDPPEQSAKIEWRNGLPEVELLIPPLTIAIFRVR
ncbi:MAG: alpha-amylase family glycosyl hydrolase [Chthoniobacteraceae bacterium]